MSAPWQVIRQIATTIKTVTWDTSPNEEVVGSSVYITGGIEDIKPLLGRMPFALLNLGDARADSDDPALLEQDIMLVLAASVGGHEMGEHAIIGGPGVGSPRSSSSQGRGIAEVEVPILAAVGRLTGADGTPVLVVDTSHTAVTFTEGKWVAHRQYVLRVTCSATEEYPAPSHLVATGGSGQIALTWDLPPSRYDLDSMVVEYASGATAPATVGAGTNAGVTTLATSKTITGLGAGTYSVAVWAKYVAFAAGDPKYSDQVTGTTRLSVSVS